ncbi:MAG: anaerobic ribonucleoside-triphosphate reductase activating protein [Proteobacteria bacterium]|nr:anaerobic ribonucleoside-triphosphate reductase activating protein [Pseudomonadota bacterium]
MNANISLSALHSSPNQPDAADPRFIKVGGFTPFTATDYPGKLSAVVFVQGCPWRCGYCHNPHLQPRLQQPRHPWPQVLEFLARRRTLLDAVVFSGGEPTVDPALHDAIADVRALGFAVGLHSAGIYPQRLAEVLPLVDWIGLDIKAPFALYDDITNTPGSGKQALAAAEAVLAAGVDYEFRTTVHSSLLSDQELIDLGHTLARMGVRNYALQTFRTQGCANEGLNATAKPGYPSEQLAQQLAALFPSFTLRRG